MTDKMVLGIFGGFLGAVLGSFLNVCIVRLPTGESVVQPRSRCPKCGYQLQWFDNIPVVSWLLLRARCRKCGEPISPLYPLVELAVALVWAGMALHYGLAAEALRGALFGTLLIGVAVTNAREYIIPNEFTLGGVVIGLLFAAVGGGNALLQSALGAAVGFGLLWLVGRLSSWLFKEDAMGEGDIRMMAMVGAFLGWHGVLLTVFLGGLGGSLLFVPLRIVAKKQFLVPFGVFLAIGAAATYFVGPAILTWYQRLLGTA
ncbi:MAG: prepilin peptidase [Gemmatimonadota bacterium]